MWSQRSLIVGLQARTMGIDAKNRLLKKAGTTNLDDPNLPADVKGKIIPYDTGFL